MLVTDRGDNLGDTFEMLMTVLLPVSRIILAHYFSFAYFCMHSFEYVLNLSWWGQDKPRD